MKERKLFIFCISFLMISFLLTQFFEQYFLNELCLSKIEEIIPSGSWVNAAGQLYRKEEASDYQILYLKNISITYQNQSIKESRIIIYNKDKNVETKIGNQIKVSGVLRSFEPASNPGNFNQKVYYQRQNIHGYIWTDKVWVNNISKHPLRNVLYELRKVWSNYLKDVAGEKYGGILCAMLLGEKTSMDVEVKELYQVNGIAHVLAISGLHLSLIGHGFYQIVRKSSGSYLAGGVVGLIFMTFYIIMIGVSVSALRAVVMFVLRVVADITGRVYDSLTAVSLAAVIVILWRPLAFYDGGFQLSFGSIIGAWFFYPVVSGEKKEKTFFVKTIMASISIQVITVPILLYHYYEFSLYSIFLNLIVVPLMSVVLLFAILSIIVGNFSCCLGNFIVEGSIWILKGYEWICDCVLEFPNARIVTGQPGLWGIVIYYLCVVVVIIIGCLIKKGKGRGLIFAGVLSMGILVLLISCPKSSEKELEITMLDVGQGDCFFVQQDDFTCLIDGGSSSESQIAKYRIEPFLKCKGVAELDYVFVSHGDLDHINGIQEMLERQREGVRINTLVLPEQSVWDDALWELAKFAGQKGVKVMVIQVGDVFEKKELKIECLYPGSGLNMVETGNEASMVLDVSFGGFDMLFTGDIESEGEKQLTNMLKKQYNVLKVAHHGSKNSTSKEFLSEVRPEIGLISVGSDNPYGHPHKETLERLKKEECRMWNTAESGAVSIKVTKTVAKLEVFQYNSCYEKFE